MNAIPDKRRSEGLPKRVLLLNDVGFQYGAGVAQARQVEAFLGLGIEVGVLAWADGAIGLEQIATRPVDLDLWLGLREVNYLEGGAKLSDDAVVAGLLMEVARFSPQVVIVGNLHAARWPLHLLTSLRQQGYRVIAFVHDAYLYTGRCAYPGGCELYLTGCNETCPTAGEYPALAPDRIADSWRLRREIFGGSHGVEVVTNSFWSTKMFRTAMPECRHVATVHLSADEKVFKPGDKHAARKLLGLPDDKPIILLAAVNFQDRRKGCQYLPPIIEALKDTVNFVAFGHNASEIPGLIGLGYHVRADKLALIYQAADIYLGTAVEEAFGQTVMEAQLCGVPVVVFQAGGVTEIVRNEITGRLVPVGDTPATIATLRATLADKLFLKEASEWSRHYTESRYSQRVQERRWQGYFLGWPRVGTGRIPPTIAYPLDAEGGKWDSSNFRPSWPAPAEFPTEEHAGIYAATAEIPGWQAPGDSFKLYEMGYYAGDVILEIGTYGGRSATVALRGALANQQRSLGPQYYGVDIDVDSIARTRQTLANEMLVDHCHLFHGVLQEFVQRWSIEPTMVFLDGDHTYAGVAADLRTLSAYLRPDTPVLLHDFLNPENDTGKIGVRRAAHEWAAAGHARFLGCFGCCALYVTLTDRP